MNRALLYCAGGGLGDSLVASVVARALHSRFGLVDALTLPSHRAVLERVPDVDEVLFDDGDDERVLAEKVASRGYDACVVTWATARTARVPELAGIPVRVGQSRRLYSFRFTDRILVRSEVGDVTTHWSQILLDYARAIDCDTSDTIPRFVPTGDDETEAAGLLATLRCTAGEYVLLHPANAIATKRGVWPTQGWAALALALHERFGLRVLVSGGDGDRRIVDAILRDAGSGVTSIAGDVGIGGFAAVARQARAFVGITTGAMHVAAAVGGPTVGIFPYQSDVPDRWAPLGKRTTVVRASYACHAGDTKESCSDYACIEHLNVPAIIAAVTSLA